MRSIMGLYILQKSNFNKIYNNYVLNNFNYFKNSFIYLIKMYNLVWKAMWISMRNRVCERKKPIKNTISLTSHLFCLCISCGCKYSHDSSCTLIGCRQTEPLPLAVRRLLLIGLLFTLISLALAIACRPTQNRNSAHTHTACWHR